MDKSETSPRRPRARSSCPTIAATMLLALVVMVPSVWAQGLPQITGSWIGTAVAIGVPLPPLTTLLTLHGDGTATETRRLFVPQSPIGPLLGTAAHGAWQRTETGELAVTILLIYQGAESHATPGEVIAMEQVRFKLRLDQTGTRLSGTVMVEIRDLEGNLIFAGPGTFEARRIGVEPLP